VTTPNDRPNWARLFRVACSLIRQVNSKDSIIVDWTFGGGTAMMLQIDHRESRDIDIFLSDAQMLPLLDPEKHDFVFDIRPPDHQGDGARFLKLAFEDLGEIDFIVGGSLTSTPAELTTVEGEAVKLETVPEIITKKIYHRASSIRPRDIFDIAAAGEKQADSIIAELKSYRDKVNTTLSVMDKLNPDFISRAIAELAIKPGYEAVAKSAMQRAREILFAV
jgi:hypothetical protein